MASLSHRKGAWELRCHRDRTGRQRTERFAGGSTRRPPEQARDRQAEVERSLRRGNYIPREEREVRFAVYFAKWSAGRPADQSQPQPHRPDPGPPARLAVLGRLAAV